MALDPSVRGLIDAIRATGMPAIGSVPAPVLRAFQEDLWAKLPPGPDVHHVENLRIPSPAGGMAARLYRPSDRPRALMVYFHGGGWTIGSLDGWDAALRRLSNVTGCAVLSVDYRLAPEARFPAAVDDAITAVAWASAQRQRLAGAAVPLVVAGDSAGGNLSAVVTQWARDHGGPAIAAQVLVYPCTDGNIDDEFLQQFDSPFMTRNEVAWFFDQYIPDRSQRQDPRFAPVRAADLGRLPPAFVLTAENDPLYPDGERYAARLKEAGGQVRVKRYLGTIHGFLTIDRGLLPHSGEAMNDIAAFLTDML